MKFAKRISLSAGAIAIVSTLALFAPKAAHAVTAALVQVVNTTANPVPNVDTERNARIPYQSSVAGSSCSSGPGACFFFFSAPPSGYRLVVENVVGYFQVSPAATAPVVGYIEDNTFAISGAFEAPLGQIDLGGHLQAAVNQPTTAYYDSTNPPFAVVSSNWSNGATRMILTGYLENCSVTGCPAVQH